MAEQHGPGCARRITERAREERWPLWDVARAIHDHCGVSLLRAHRLASGWTLVEATERVRLILRDRNEPSERLAHQRLSRWETGPDVPHLRYLDALCQLYRTRPDRLGYGRDHSQDAGQGQSGPAWAPTPATAARRPDACGPGVAVTGEGERMRRRDLLRSLAAYGGVAASAPMFEALRTIRVDADELLDTQSVSATTVDNWELVASDYGHRQITTPPHVFLVDAMCDFAELRRILSHRQPLEFQRRLYRVMAQLAGLIAVEVNDVGDLRETHAWLHTARLAADESGDRALRAWVTTKEGMLYLWYGRPAERAVELSRTAQAMAGPAPTTSAALAALVEARGQARLGRRSEALAAISRSEAIFERLAPSETRVTMLGLDEHRFRWNQQNALTVLGETSAAMAIQEHEFTLSEIDLALVSLDRATCLIRAGEPEEGYRTAGRALLRVPVGSRRGLPVFRAREILGTSDRHRGNATVRDLREIVRASVMPVVPAPR